MLLLRYGITVSAVLGLIFLAESSVKAQTQSAADLLKKPRPTANPVSQLPGPSAAPATTEADTKAPNYLNPSGNPLIFPTKPDEVNIRVVQPITLNQAIELALKNNQTLQTARINLEIARAQLKEQQAALLPTASAEASITQDQSALAQRQNELAGTDNPEDSTNLQGNVQIVYGVYTGGERAAQIKRAEKVIRQQELEVERVSEQTRFDATDAYYELQRGDAQVAIAQASIEDASQSLRDAQLLEQAGLGTRFAVLQAEVDLANANQDLTRAISNQRISRRRLAQILSVGQHIELTAADEIREAGTWGLSLDDSIVLAYKNRAELEQQLLQREISAEDRSIAISAVIPQVDLLGAYNVLNDLSDEAGFGDGFSVGGRIRWTFFDGGRAFARARQAERNIDRADTEFSLRRNEIRLQVEESYYSLISNQENIKTSQKSIESATESLRLARLRFQAGVGTQTDVINSQRDLTDARSRYLQAIVDYNRSLNSLQRAISNLPDNRLFEVR
ncbi:MAG: TolC family protein [Microcystis aeruginosa L111-01]|nr:TolC family protein [Microcystis aeruginosa W13-16]NCQ76065.1 TolC family protein [Microcystis aeruginosa W13-13]NCQ80571.1 TolC family protein [Microcystis aeruginosa W13-15]NCR23700.1 TolC family protein [Microcystis aeruginosa L111-01]NCS13298.1 TolC family protein [Microcystis aeruginosa G13-09]NCS54634.1 TolC family protein [Microcystis aeruginosa G13-05]